MSGPEIDRWRDVFSRSYRYPADIGQVDSSLSRRKARRAVRRNKRDWRRADHDARQQFFARQRREESISPEGRLGCAVVITAVAVVLMLAGLIRACTSGDEAAAPSGPPAAETTTPGASASSAASSTASSATPSPSPSPTVTAATAAEDIARQWATAWFTFTPTQDDNPATRLKRAAPYMTAELTEYLSTPDPSARYYRTHGIDSTVTAVDLAGPGPGEAPADTVDRLTRITHVTSTYTAGPDTGKTFTMAYGLTLVRPDLAQAWQVGSFTSGDG